MIIGCMLIVKRKHVFAYSMPNIRKRKTDRGVPLPFLVRPSDKIKQGNSVREVVKWHLPCDPVLFSHKEIEAEVKGIQILPRVGCWTVKTLNFLFRSQNPFEKQLDAGS